MSSILSLHFWLIHLNGFTVKAIDIPFCEVGPFVVPAAASGAKITAIEKNTEACKWLAENVGLNGVESNVSIINADASDIVNIPDIHFDRAIVPTPYGLDSYLEGVLQLVKRGGMVRTSIRSS